MSIYGCPLCGREFTTMKAFDRHQDVDYQREPDIICKDPATAGLVQNDRGRWHSPADARARARLRALRASEGRTYTPGTPREAEAL
jgi:hypothetical protein